MTGATGALVMKRTQANSSRRAVRKGDSRKRASRAHDGMDVLELLKEDHRVTEDLLAELIAALEGDGLDAEKQDECREVFEQLYAELTAHAKAEDELVYGSLEGERQITPLVLQARIEHGLVAQLLEELHDSEIDLQWAAKMRVVAEMVNHHVKEEEKKMLPAAERVLEAERRSELARSFVERKEEVISSLEMEEAAAAEEMTGEPAHHPR
jgi:hemerythrin superfamily protein